MEILIGASIGLCLDAKGKYYLQVIPYPSESSVLIPINKEVANEISVKEDLMIEVI